MEQDSVLIERIAHGVLVATLNRPDRGNARNEDMQTNLLTLVKEVHSNKDIRALVLTGAGHTAFCGGMDLSEQLSSRQRGQARIESDFALYDAMEACPKPVIVAINGAAVGGGFDLVLASDLAFAEAHATFRCPETALGLVPVFAMLRLPSIIGPQRAAAVMLQDRPISASEALSWGLVTEVVPTGSSLDRAISLAAQLAVLDQVTVGLLKTVLKGNAECVRRPEIAALVSELFQTPTYIKNVSRFRTMCHEQRPAASGRRRRAALMNPRPSSM